MKEKTSAFDKQVTHAILITRTSRPTSPTRDGVVISVIVISQSAKLAVSAASSVSVYSSNKPGYKN